MSGSSEPLTATPFASPLHPHERWATSVPPTLDPEGRCLVCRILVDLDRHARMLDYLWNAELPIAAAMRAQKAIGDAMTVRDVFNYGAADGDPLVTDIDLLLAPFVLARLSADTEANHE